MSKVISDSSATGSNQVLAVYKDTISYYLCYVLHIYMHIFIDEMLYMLQEQYKFIHEALVAMLKRYSNYANFTVENSL